MMGYLCGSCQQTAPEFLTRALGVNEVPVET